MWLPASPAAPRIFREIRRLLNAGDSKMRIIAKIENREGVDNIDEILAAADAVMIARGDMGVEIDFYRDPHDPEEHHLSQLFPAASRSSPPPRCWRA